MLPTLNVNGDVVLVERVSVLNRRIEVGDVVVAVSPTNPKDFVCKRVIGMVRVPSTL